MRLLIVRHAIAEDRETFALAGRDDSLRPLTDDGRRKMRRAAAGLASLVESLAVIATSPFTRAAETATILAAAFSGPGPMNIDALAPDAHPDALLRALPHLDASATIALVGHEPQLSRLAAWLLIGELRPFVVLKKGGACLVEFAEAPRAGGGSLLWSLTPSQLRRLAP